MSTRPQDWLPLSERDPLPGDPMRIAQEASRVRDLGAAMRGQVTRLREIGADNAGTGLYAEKLREAANDLAAKLDKVVGRYEKTATALKDWAPELGRFQDLTLAARTKALAAEELRRTNNAVTAVLAPGQELTPAQDAAARDRQIALDEAATMLRQARDQMQDAVDDARSAGRTYRDKIRDAIDDDAKDSWWDNRKDWIDRNAGWIKGWSDALSWVATGAAIIAVGLSLLIPGVNVVVLTTIAVVATFGAAAGHGALAASGSGSWVDFGFDIFALATFGAGRLVTSGLRGAAAATRATGLRVTRDAATRASREATAPIRQRAARTLADPRSSAGARRGARAALRRAERQARTSANRAADEFRAVLREPTRGEIFRAGEFDNAAAKVTIDAVRNHLPASEAVRAAARSADQLDGAGQLLFRAGITADLGDKLVSARSEEYVRFKDRLSREVGSRW